MTFLLIHHLAISLCFFFLQKSKLKLECEQEMLKVRKKYDILLQDAESEYVQSKKTLATIYDKVLMNQVLAEEFRAKFVENKGGSSSTSQGRILDKSSVRNIWLVALMFLLNFHSYKCMRILNPIF